MNGTNTEKATFNLDAADSSINTYEITLICSLVYNKEKKAINIIQTLTENQRVIKSHLTRSIYIYKFAPFVVIFFKTLYLPDQV